MKLKPVSEQVVVIFGASSGIGRATALMFAARGAKVVVSARGGPGLESLVQEIQDAGGSAHMVVADATSYADVQRVAEEAHRIHGRIDTWLHGAALYLIAPFENTDMEEYERIIDVNLLGYIRGAKAAWPYLKANTGSSFICISSIEARCAFPWHSAYAAAKQGITGFLDALRVEALSERLPINITNVMPATVDTPFFSKGRSKIGVKPGAPGPIYEPELVAQAIVRAAEKPTRDIIVGDSGVAYVAARQFMPAVADRMLLVAIKQQMQSDEQRTADSPDNFYASLPDYRVHGDYHAKATNKTALSLLSSLPAISAAAGVMLFLGASLLRR